MRANSVQYDMNAVMFDALIEVPLLAQHVSSDAAVSYHTDNFGQAKRYSESCINNMKTLRDKLNELLSQADVAGYREVA